VTDMMVPKVSIQSDLIFDVEDIAGCVKEDESDILLLLDDMRK